MRLLVCSALLLVFGLRFSEAGELMKLSDFLKTELKDLKASKESFILSSEDSVAIKKLAPDADETEFTFYYGKTSAGVLKKACSAVSQRGKEGPMVIGVCFDPSGLVSSVHILAYVEERGKGIADESFLNQFRGKKVSDAFQVGKDVDGISGATMSSKAVSEALRKIGFVLNKFVRK